MRVCLLGPPMSGKTTLFSAVVEAGGTTVDLSRPDQPHSAMVKVPDGRVDRLAEIHERPRAIHPDFELLDLPGLDLSGEAGRTRARASGPAMRQSDMLVFVVRSFADETVPPYRGRVDPAADVLELRDEMLFADLEQVANRIEKLEAAVKKPTPDRDEQRRELAVMRRLRESLENEEPISAAIDTAAEAPFLRSFAFLSLKPVFAVLNRGEDETGPGKPCVIESLPAMVLSAKIERELAQLPPDEREEFLSVMDLDEPAAGRFIRACYDRLDLVTFLTVGDRECRGWSVPAGTSAVAAAGKIHTDIARGFIRAETVAYDDFIAAGGAIREARARGTVRLEGKDYIVQDGDIIQFRFNV